MVPFLVRAQCHQALDKSGPCVASGYQLFCKLCGPSCQWPGDEIGGGLPCRSIVVHCQLQP